MSSQTTFWIVVVVVLVVGIAIASYVLVRVNRIRIAKWRVFRGELGELAKQLDDATRQSLEKAVDAALKERDDTIDVGHWLGYLLFPECCKEINEVTDTRTSAQVRIHCGTVRAIRCQELPSRGKAFFPKVSAELITVLREACQMAKEEFQEAQVTAKYVVYAFLANPQLQTHAGCRKRGQMDPKMVQVNLASLRKKLGSETCGRCGTLAPAALRAGAVVSGSDWGLCKPCQKLFCGKCVRKSGEGTGLVFNCCPDCNATLRIPGS